MLKRVCKELENGDMIIKLDSEYIRDMEKDDVSVILSVMSDACCQFIGDTYCLDDFETGHTIYNYFSDVIYVFPWRYLDDLKQGKSVKLIAEVPDEDDRELIRDELGYDDDLDDDLDVA